MARRTAVRACWVSRWIKTSLYGNLDPDTYFWPYISQIGDKVLIESRNYEVLGLIAQTLAQRSNLHIEWGGQWLSEQCVDWENWLEVSYERTG